jgi:6-pyruvoyltetrahydropterin/6-carboxytetrahydropterin synthase
MMFTVRKHIEIDAGHRVPYHASKCRHLHGHRYRVTAVVGAFALVAPETQASDAGMVLDFGVIKDVLNEVVHDRCDHKLLLWNGDPLVAGWKVYPDAPTDLFQKALMAEHLTAGLVILPCIPTAEELARYWGTEILKITNRVWDERLKLVGIDVMETPTSTATWTNPLSALSLHHQELNYAADQIR